MVDVTSDPSAATSWLARLEGGPCGVAIEASTRGHAQRAMDDPRDKAIVRVALARSDSEVLVLEGSAIAGAGLNALAPPERAPYLVFHDAHFALALLATIGVHPTRYGCTTVAATLLAEGADGRHDDRPLAEQVRQVLGRPLAGDLLADGAVAQLELLRAYTPLLRERGLARLFELECRLLGAVVDMEAVGMPLRVGEYERVATGWERERHRLGTLAAEDPERAQLPRLDKLIAAYRYWARDFVDQDGRVRCRLRPLAADSGRFSCTSPNLQQVPAEHTAPGLRAAFHAPKGRTFVIADYAQIELRIAAALAPCPEMTAVFRGGADPHRATAATLTGRAEVGNEERKLAKAINFGFLFGMGARRFRDYAAQSFGIALDDGQASRAREAFFATFPGIARWHARTRDLARVAEREPVTVTTVMGRRKRFDPGTFSFNAALNIPVQGTAAEGFKAAMARLRAELASLNGRGVLCVHDEYIAEVPEDRAAEARTRVEAVMVESMQALVPAVPIVVETRVAPHWGEQ